MSQLSFFAGVGNSSEREDWRTPKRYIDMVNRVAPLVVDPCTDYDNPTGAKICFVAPGAIGPPTPGVEFYEDGLHPMHSWAASALQHDGLVFVNHPYGRGIVEPWLRKCLETSRSGLETSIIALPPARTDTAWWHEFCVPRKSGGAVCLVEGRITFDAPYGQPEPDAAPFPSAFVYWGPRSLAYRFADVFQEIGEIWM